MLSQGLIDSLFPPDLPEPEHWERRYPPRDLPAGAEVTRFAPSPTGFLHIGGVYTATIDVDVARHSGGRYLVRVEDTDQARIAAGAAEQFAEADGYFGIGPDEDDATGGLDPHLVRAVASAFAGGYRPDAEDWAGQVRQLAAGLGFAPSQKAYKQHPAAYPGSIAEVFGVVRVLLTGTPQSPSLALVAAALGPAEVLRRVRALTGPTSSRRRGRPP